MPSLSVNNSNNRFTLTLTVTETGTSVANNTSTCSWSLDLKANTAYNFTTYAIGYSVTLNGVSVGYRARSANVKYSIADYGTINIASGTGVVIQHADDGSLIRPVTFGIDMAAADYTPGALSSSGTMTLSKLARYSTLNVANGTLGVAQTITVTQQSTSYNHTIKWVCGTATGDICSNSSATSFSFTPDIALASQNTTGSSVVINFTITTVGVGDKTASATYAIPDSVKPSVTLGIADASGCYTTYGAYVQGYSKLTLTANTTLAYGSPIKSYVITADDKSYSATTVTTPVLQNTGKLPVTAVVTDARSRPSTKYSTDITVLKYEKPVVTVAAYRCNSSGTVDPEGAYMKIGFSATITNLNNKNNATYTISYKQSGGSATTLTGSGLSYTSGAIACDTTKVWEIEATVKDNLSSSTKAAVIPIAFTLMEFYSTGKGVSFGKIATQDGFDCAMDAVFRGAVTFEKTPSGIPTGTSYTLPTASTTTLGGVKVDGSTVTISSGVISAKQYTLPTANTSTLGGVKVDGSTITASNGIISATRQSSITKIVTYTAGTTATSYSFAPGSYDLVCFGLTPSASGAIIATCVPGAMAAGGCDFQVADESSYCKWSLSASGVSRATGAGNIRYIYGIKL